MGGLLGARTGLILISGAVLSVVIFLLILILTIAFQDPLDSSVYTLQNFRDLYLEPFVYSALLNTAGFTVVTVITALFFAVPIAWLAERTDLPGRSWVFPLMTASAVIPGTFGALGWLFMLHPRIGTINRWLMDMMPFLDSAPINIISVQGMGFISGGTSSSTGSLPALLRYRRESTVLQSTL